MLAQRDYIGSWFPFLLVAVISLSQAQYPSDQLRSYRPSKAFAQMI